MTANNLLHFLVAFVERMHDPRFAAQRRGQRAFNVLFEHNPHLANRVRGTKNDPFYRDEALDDFLTFVVSEWHR